VGSGLELTWLIHGLVGVRLRGLRDGRAGIPGHRPDTPKALRASAAFSVVV